MSRNCRHEDSSLSPAEREARRQIRKLRGFYQHLTVFVAVNLGLLAINLLSTPTRLWFYWPVFGWGIALVLHAGATQLRGRWLGADWEERKLRELLADKR